MSLVVVWDRFVFLSSIQLIFVVVEIYTPQIATLWRRWIGGQKRTTTKCVWQLFLILFYMIWMVLVRNETICHQIRTLFTTFSQQQSLIDLKSYAVDFCCCCFVWVFCVSVWMSRWGDVYVMCERKCSCEFFFCFLLKKSRDLAM